MAETIYYRFVLKRDTAANFTAANTLLLAGEMGIETDSRRWKLGDGATAWNLLQYQDGALKLEYFDVDSAARDDGKALLWDEALQKHVYGTVAGGGGGGGGGPFEFVAEVIVASAQPDIDFSGLDLDADAEYLLAVYAVQSAASVNHALQLFYNGDTTLANYQRQSVLVAHTSMTANRASDPYILYARNPSASVDNVLAGTIRISKAAGRKPIAVVQGNSWSTSTAGLETYQGAHVYSSTVNVIAIKLRHLVNFGVGTRVRLYRLTKAAPSTVGTQVGYARTSSATSATTTASIPLDATIPQATEGAAYAALDTTITPSSATSLLEVEVSIPYLTASTAAHLVGALFRDAGADAIAAGATVAEAADASRQLTVRAVVAAGSTAATTFKFRWGVSTGTGYLLRNTANTITFGGVAAATMTVKEIGQ